MHNLKKKEGDNSSCQGKSSQSRPWARREIQPVERGGGEGKEYILANAGRDDILWRKKGGGKDHPDYER